MHGFGVTTFTQKLIVFYCSCGWWMEAYYSHPPTDAGATWPAMSNGSHAWQQHVKESEGE